MLCVQRLFFLLSLPTFIIHPKPPQHTGWAFHSILVGFTGGAVVPRDARSGAQVGREANRGTEFSRGAQKAGCPKGGGTNCISVGANGALFDVKGSAVVGDDGGHVLLAEEACRDVGRHFAGVVPTWERWGRVELGGTGGCGGGGVRMCA